MQIVVLDPQNQAIKRFDQDVKLLKDFFASLDELSPEMLDRCFTPIMTVRLLIDADIDYIRYFYNYVNVLL
jgi:hypothetical protein